MQVSSNSHVDVSQILVCVGRVLPSLRQHAIVPVNVVWVKAQLPLLRVLLDGSQLLILLGKNEANGRLLRLGISTRCNPAGVEPQKAACCMDVCFIPSHAEVQERR